MPLSVTSSSTIPTSTSLLKQDLATYSLGSPMPRMYYPSPHAYHTLCSMEPLLYTLYTDLCSPKSLLEALLKTDYYQLLPLNLNKYLHKMKKIGGLLKNYLNKDKKDDNTLF